MDDAEEPVLALADRRTLLASELGEGLDPRGVARLFAAGCFRLSSAARGEILALTGAPQSTFVLVLSGRLEVVRTRADGARTVMDVLSPGDPCGAVTAIARHPRWPAEVHALEDTRLLVVDVAALRGSSDAAAVAAWGNVLTLVASRARHLSFRTDLLRRRGLRERLAFFLLEKADDAGAVALRLTRQELADFLGVSRSAMTRELGRMTDDGLIRLVGRGFELLDPDALAHLAA